MRKITGDIVRPAALTVVAAILLASAPALAAGAAPPAPLALTEVEGDPALVQTTRQGVLVLVPSSGIRMDPVSDAVDSYLLGVEDSSVRVVFCPAALLDPASPDPATDCLDEAASGESAMLSGFGHVRASGLADRRGLPGCPASVEVGASVRSPGGDLLDLSGTLVLAPSSDGAECRVVQEDLRLGYEGPGGEAGATWSELESRAAAGELDWSRWESLEPLLRLDEQEWDLLEEILFMDDDQWAALEGGLVSADLTGTSPGSVKGGNGSTAITTHGVSDLFNTILARLNDLRSRVAAIRSVLGENRPDLKGLVQSIEVPKLRQLIEETRATLDGLLDTAQELRQGYESFAPGGSCDAGAPCVAFRNELRRVIDDLERGFEMVQRLACFERPQLEIRELDTRLMRLLLLEKAPPLMLYVGSRFLERIPEWSDRLGHVLDEIPVELTQFCEEPGTSPLRVMSREDRCEKILAVPEERFHRVKSVLGFSKAGVELVIPWIDEKKTVTLGAVAVGGATIGTDVKVPVKPVLEDIKVLIEGIGLIIEARSSFRASCARERDAAAQELAARELALRQCSPDVGTFLGDAGIQPSADLVQQYIDEMTAKGLDIREAQELHGRALAAIDERDGFDLLCSAYDELVRPATKKRGGAVRVGKGRLESQASRR